MSSLGPPPYIPPHLEDETLYGYLGRVNAYNCAGSSRQFLHEIFGHSKAVSSADLPTSLTAMVTGRPEVSPYPGLKDVIERTTQYPYHRPFMPSERWAKLLDRASKGPGHELKTWMGLVAHRFGATSTFRSCVHCDREAWDTVGFLYWRRTHLLPGVLICPIHQTPLVKHFVQSEDSARSALRRLPAGGSPIRVPRTALDPLTRFATTSLDVLSSTPLELTGERCTATYLARLEEMGICRAPGQVRWRELSSLLLASNNDFKGWDVGERISQTKGGVLGWLYGLVRDRGRLSHPLTHILLINSLFGSLAEYAQATRPSKAVAQPERPNVGPPPEDALVSDVNISCRALALRLGASVTTVVQRRRVLGLPIAERRKSITPERIAQAVSMLVSGASAAAVAGTTRLSLCSVYRIRATAATRLVAGSQQSRAELASVYRLRWTATESCGGSVRQRRVLDGAAYSWLYRNDREWLRNQRFHSTSLLDQRMRRSRIDWNKRDQSYSRRMAAMAEDIKSRPMRKRVSPSTLIRATAPESSIRANLDRLPRYREALQSCSETVSQFQRWRYTRTVEDLCDEDGGFSQWKALRLAGLRRVPPLAD